MRARSGARTLDIKISYSRLTGGDGERGATLPQIDGSTAYLNSHIGAVEPRNDWQRRTQKIDYPFARFDGEARLAERVVRELCA